MEFQVGDRVRLVKPFRYRDDSKAEDKEFHDRLLAITPHPGGLILGEVVDIFYGMNQPPEISIRYDSKDVTYSSGFRLLTDEDVIALDEPLADEEVLAAIASIQTSIQNEAQGG